MVTPPRHPVPAVRRGRLAIPHAGTTCADGAEVMTMACCSELLLPLPPLSLVLFVLRLALLGLSTNHIAVYIHVHHYVRAPPVLRLRIPRPSSCFFLPLHFHRHHRCRCHAHDEDDALCKDRLGCSCCSTAGSCPTSTGCRTSCASHTLRLATG